MPDRRRASGAVALAAVLALCVPAAASAGSLAEDVTAAMRAQPARSVRFVEEKRLSSLAAPLVSSGRMVFVPPSRLEKLTEQPKPEQLVIDGDQVSIADAAGRRSVPLDDAPGLRPLAETLEATLGGDLPALRRLYAIEEQGSMDSWRLLLTPVQPALRRALTRVTLDGGGARLRQIVIQQPNGDEQRLTVSPE